MEAIQRVWGLFRGRESYSEGVKAIQRVWRLFRGYGGYSEGVGAIQRVRKLHRLPLMDVDLSLTSTLLTSSELA